MIKIKTSYPVIVNDKFHSAEGDVEVTEKVVSKKTTTIKSIAEKKATTKEDGVLNYNILSGQDEVMKDYNENDVSNFEGKEKDSQAKIDNILFGIALGALGFVLYNKLSRK